MTPDRLEKMLRELPAPPSAEARERTVAEARAEVSGREAPAQRARPAGRRMLATALAAAVLAAALLTPPGRDASAWVGELVGIGDVGGSPTLEEHGFAGTSRGVVIANGEAPDGSRYEWIVYDCKVDLREEGLPTRFEGFGMSLEWPHVKGREGGGSCEEAGGASEAHGAFEQIGVHIAPSQFEGVAEPDLLVSGATTRRVHRVEVVYTDTGGERHELPVDFAHIPNDLRERLGERSPGGAFVAFVPGDWAARDDVASRLDLRALTGTGKLELSDFARREREQLRAAYAACAHLMPDPSKLPAEPDLQAVERHMGPHRRCVEERRPPSPVEAIAYDEQGGVVERWEEPLSVPMQIADFFPKGPVPWDERPAHGEDAIGEPVVLIGGRAPGGARYEFFVERVGTGGKQTGVCTTLWWPRFQQAGAGGHCGPQLPPVGAFGRRSPEDVMAKPFGFLDDVRPATGHWILSGYARPRVARVAVTWEGGEATAELTRVDGALRERMGAYERFGFWVAFVPREARHARFEIVAYDEGGGQIGSYEYRSDVTN
jgi:hypothetical protein